MEQILRAKLGDCKFAVGSLCRAKSSYETTCEKEFYIFDPPSETNQPIRIVSLIDEHQLKIRNSEGKDICVVKTDKCLFPQEISKCDCLLISDKDLYFVEIKDSKISQRHTNRKRAVEQLEATINSIIEHQIEYSTFVSKAVICFKSENSYPIRASFQSQKEIFREKYNISLEEGNKIDF